MAQYKDEAKHYSYVDVLERVSDGVHVQLVRRPAKSAEVARANDKPRRASPSRKRAKKHDRDLPDR